MTLMVAFGIRNFSPAGQLDPSAMGVRSLARFVVMGVGAKIVCMPSGYDHFSAIRGVSEPLPTYTCREIWWAEVKGIIRFRLLLWGRRFNFFFSR